MLWVAIFGIIINGAAALRVKRGTSLNERAVYLHIMEDVLGWAGVLVVSIVMLFAPVAWLDSLLSIAITVWVLINVMRNLRSVFAILLQAAPGDVPLDELQRRITAIEGIDSVHDLHLWSLDGETHVMTLHVVSDASDTPTLKSEIAAIGSDYHISHTTIELERTGEHCHRNCDQPG